MKIEKIGLVYDKEYRKAIKDMDESCSREPTEQEKEVVSDFLWLHGHSHQRDIESQAHIGRYGSIKVFEDFSSNHLGFEGKILIGFWSEDNIHDIFQLTK